VKLFAGAVLERPPGQKYVSELRFAELAPQRPLPKPATLERWRKKLPSGFEVALRAPNACFESPSGPLRAGPELDAGLRWLEEAVNALEARILVVPTGATVTTGARDRERLRDFFARMPRAGDRVIAWKPSGLWEPDAVRAMAATLSVLGGVDPIDDPIPNGEVVYAHLLAEGLRRSFSHAQLLEALDKLERSGASSVYVSIESPQSFREARLLQALSEGRA
jgi:uncharacterized protein YecE (DUF72 family)